MNTIEFVKVDEISELYHPYPAGSKLPDWYLNTKPGTGNPLDGAHASSIRHCMPSYDAITAGYIIPTHAEYWVSQVEDNTEPNGKRAEFTMREGIQRIVSQPGIHAPNHPQKGPHKDFMKFASPWIFKTPPGYSTLFVPPMQAPNDYFTALPAIIDTDSFYHRIAFPFTLNDPEFTGLIPAGIPMIQVIPFKRDQWKMEIKDVDIKLATEAMARHASKFHRAYLSLFWSKKSFK